MKNKTKKKKLHIKKGDTVMVITGEYKGEQGRVLKVFPKINKAIVEGINIVKKHTKPSQDNPKGGILPKEAPVHVSNLMLIDPESGEPTRIAYKKDKNNKTVRFSKKSGKIIK